jgi:hypothetical protein
MFTVSLLHVLTLLSIASEPDSHSICRRQTSAPHLHRLSYIIEYSSVLIVFAPFSMHPAIVEPPIGSKRAAADSASSISSLPTSAKRRSVQAARKPAVVQPATVVKSSATAVLATAADEYKIVSFADAPSSPLWSAGTRPGNACI